MQWIYITALVLLGTAWCQNEIPEDFQDLEKNLANIPGLENFNQSALPSVDELQDALRKKCEKNGGADVYDKLEAAKDNLQQCIQDNFNFTKIQEELAVSRKTGSMEEVFAKYCKKSPIVQACIQNMTDTIKPCLEEEEKNSLKLVLNVTESLASFACYKDGDRIAMFVAEGGFECLDSKKDGLQQCANETLSHRIPSDISLNNLPLFVINEDGCDDYSKLQSCVVGVLETCEDNTPANIIDALFKFIRRITPCKNRPAPTSVLGARQYRIARSNPNELGPLYDAYRQLREKYEPHCLNIGGQKAVQEFSQALDQVEICQSSVVNTFKQKTQEEQKISFNYICKDFRSGLRNCLENLTKKMKACASDKEKYIPKFGLDLYDSIFEFHCKDDARALKKFLGERDPCLNKVHEATNTCLGKTKHIRDYKQAVVTKIELCRDLKQLKNCFVDVGNQQCRSNSDVTEFITGFTDAIYAPCSGCATIMNLMLISILLLFTKFL